MSNKKLGLLAGMYAMSIPYLNAYESLSDLTYYNGSKSGRSKLPLTKKQKKSRAASKRAKQARKRNR